MHDSFELMCFPCSILWKKTAQWTLGRQLITTVQDLHFLNILPPQCLTTREILQLHCSPTTPNIRETWFRDRDQTRESILLGFQDHELMTCPVVAWNNANQPTDTATYQRTNAWLRTSARFQVHSAIYLFLWISLRSLHSLQWNRWSWARSARARYKVSSLFSLSRYCVLRWTLFIMCSNRE